MRVSAALGRLMLLARMTTVRTPTRMIACSLPVINSSLGSQQRPVYRLFPKLFVESLAVQFFYEPVVIEFFRLGRFRLRISRRNLIQHFLDTLACVVGNLVHIVHGVLVNRIVCLGIDCTAVIGYCASAKLPVCKQPIHALTVSLKKSPRQIFIGSDEGTAPHKGVMRKVDSGLAHVHEHFRPGLFGPKIRRTGERSGNDSARTQHCRRSKEISRLYERHISSGVKSLLT